MPLTSRRQENVSTCHWHHNARKTSYRHASDVTISAQCHFSTPLTSKCQQNVVSTSYRRHNVITTSFHHATDFTTLARHIDVPLNVIATSEQRCIDVLPSLCWRIYLDKYPWWKADTGCAMDIWLRSRGLLKELQPNRTDGGVIINSCGQGNSLSQLFSVYFFHWCSRI